MHNEILINQIPTGAKVRLHLASTHVVVGTEARTEEDRTLGLVRLKNVSSSKESSGTEIFVTYAIEVVGVTIISA
jgi:hypothetical protein